MVPVHWESITTCCRDSSIAPTDRKTKSFKKRQYCLSEEIFQAFRVMKTQFTRNLLTSCNETQQNFVINSRKPNGGHLDCHKDLSITKILGAIRWFHQLGFYAGSQNGPFLRPFIGYIEEIKFHEILSLISFPFVSPQGRQLSLSKPE